MISISSSLLAKPFSQSEPNISAKEVLARSLDFQ